MASCSCESGKDYVDVDELLNNPNKRKEMTELTHIDKDLFVKGDRYTMLKVLHCADEEAFIKSFCQYKDLDLSGGVSDEDLRTLAEMWRTGADLKIGFDIKQTLKDIKADPKKLANCNIKFV